MRKRITSFAIVALALLMAPQSYAQASSLPDFDGNGTVDFPDFLLFVGKFGARQGDERYGDRFDLDGDGAVMFPDFLIFASNFGKTVPLTVDRLNFPLRALHAAGHWGTNETVVYDWEANGRQGSLVPSDYIEWLKGLHVNWVGFMVSLHYDDSMDSTVERDYLTLEGRTFPDDVLRQMIRDFRDHGIEVYLTLALSDHEAGQAAHPAHRWQLGHPDPPHNILPENWPWRPDHPGHQRFVAEFWETYTQQAVHFARIAEDEGARLYSLGTETDRLFRTRSGDPDNPNERDWTNNFGQELKAMVDRVRAVYSGLLTYDMHYSVLLDPEYFGPGSNHLWKDLDLDIVGVSAYFPLTDTVPTIPISVETAQKKYEETFSNSLKPLAQRNPDRPIMFLEYGAVDVVPAPVAPDASDFSEYVFTDLNGNGLDDGQETQANMYQGLINAMANNPGVLDGVFYWDNWMTSDELWAEWWVKHRSFSIKEKLAEKVIRSAYQSYKQASGR